MQTSTEIIGVLCSTSRTMGYSRKCLDRYQSPSLFSPGISGPILQISNVSDRMDQYIFEAFWLDAHPYNTEACWQALSSSSKTTQAIFGLILRPLTSPKPRLQMVNQQRTPGGTW